MLFDKDFLGPRCYDLIELYFSILGSEAKDKQHNRCVMCGKYASFYAHHQTFI